MIILSNTNLHIRRFELKYLIHKRQLDNIRKSISHFVASDPFASGQNYYQVSSIYFDDLNLNSYFEKLAGLKLRRKLRIRTYDKNVSNKSKVFLEVKRKDELVVFKDRVSVSLSDAREILENSGYNLLPSGDDLKSSNSFISHFLRKRVSPVVLVSYKREAYFDKMNSSFRITLDQDLKAKKVFGLDFDLDNYCKVIPNYAVVEAKFNRVMPAWFGMIVKEKQLQRVAFSKYCFSLESCDIVWRNDLPVSSIWI